MTHDPREQQSTDESRRREIGRRDVEKRWSDDGVFRAAGRYLAAVLILTAIVCAVAIFWAAAGPCRDADQLLCDTPTRTMVLLGPAVVLLCGGIGAFVRAVRVWRAGGAWPIWQGAGWGLLLFMVVYLGIGSTTLAAG